MKISYKLIRLLLPCFFLSISYNSAAQEICNNGKDDNGNGLTDLYDPACHAILL
jgi:hypothetical protein